MDILDLFDFDAVAEGDPFEVHTVTPEYTKVVSELEDAIRKGRLVSVKDVFGALRRMGMTQQRVKSSRSFLYLAILHSRVDVAEYLLLEGVEISSLEVQCATEKSDIAALELLVNHGWDINRQIGWFVPPALAFATDHVDLCCWFLAHGADPNAGCVLDMTPLSAAVQYGPLDVINLLFDHGGSIERGELLHYAIWRDLDDRLEIVDLLIRKGAPINMLTYQNRPDCWEQRKFFGLGTPLHDAAAMGDENVVRLLLNEGADVSTSTRDSLGLLPYQRAERKGHKVVADLLQSVSNRLSLKPKI
ncbi:hypothetical protein LTR27_006628 [Elasticomyces elasticus]|nr:hypothetical protein LTR27_006628 [Elasticomyces elasticus]